MPPPAPEPQSYYAILNVPSDASEDIIRRAYRQLAATYHPDKHGDPALQQEASRMFHLVQEAYEVRWAGSVHHSVLWRPADFAAGLSTALSSGRSA